MAVTYPTCTMQKSGGELYTFPAPSPGGTFRTARAQSIGQTAAGGFVNYDKNATWYECSLRFDYLSATDKSNMETHFAAVAGGAFTYIDSASNSFTAYFLDDTLAWTQRVRGAYDLTIRMRLDSSGD